MKCVCRSYVWFINCQSYSFMWDKQPINRLHSNTRRLTILTLRPIDTLRTRIVQQTYRIHACILTDFNEFHLIKLALLLFRAYFFRYDWYECSTVMYRTHIRISYFSAFKGINCKCINFSHPCSHSIESIRNTF